LGYFNDFFVETYSNTKNNLQLYTNAVDNFVHNSKHINCHQSILALIKI